MKKTIDYDDTIKSLRDRGVTVIEIAERLGVTKAAVQQMELSGRDILLKKISGKWHYCEIKDWRRDPVKKGGRGRPSAVRPARLKSA